MELVRLESQFNSIDDVFSELDVSIAFLESEGYKDFQKLDEKTRVTPYFTLHSYVQNGPDYDREDVLSQLAIHPSADFGYGNVLVSPIKKLVLFEQDEDTHPDVREINLLERIMRRGLDRGSYIPIVTISGDIDFENIVNCMNSTGKYTINLIECKSIFGQGIIHI